MIKLKHIYKMVETDVIYIKVTKNSALFPGLFKKMKIKKS